MVYFSLADLLQFGVVSETTTVRRRRGKSSSESPTGKNDQSNIQRASRMVPQINVIDVEAVDAHREDDSSQDGEVNEDSTKTKAEAELFVAVKDEQRQNSCMNGSIDNLDQLTNNQLEPLLQQEDDDEFKTEMSGTDSTQESSLGIALQVFFPFLVAGFGTVAAGLLLDLVQHWKVFNEISEIFILVPALLGLKGNLEMTLASRLSTAANVGLMENRKHMLKLIGGNLALIQVQAIAVGALAAIAAVIMGWVLDGHFDINHATLLCASSLVTATLASFILGSVMVAVIICSQKCSINPDNVATPIAASLGDLITLALLSGISRFLHNCIGTHHWIAPLICFGFFLLVPMWWYITHHNHYTTEVLYSGWSPVISAMVISSIGGLILDYAVTSYNGIAVFNPVMNGVGGNLVAVQASRLSTSLHRLGKPGHVLESDHYNGCIDTFFGSGAVRISSHHGVHARTARVLLFMVIPGHLVFLYAVRLLQAGHTSQTLVFTLAYLCAALLQVVFLLLVANWLVHLVWRRGKDPDNYCIPYLTALGDLLGTGLLALTFHILWLAGDRDSDVGD